MSTGFADTVPAAHEIPAEAVDAALVAHQQEVRHAAALTEPTDLPGMARHEEALARAEQQMAAGEPVRVADVVRPAIDREANFRAWFGDSKVVDGEGKPLVVYHGTRSDFESFDPAAPRSIQQFGDAQGLYFTRHPEDASGYAARGGGEGASVVPAYVALRNPYVWPESDLAPAVITAAKRAELEAAGHDGIIYRGGDEVIAFHPEQVKSAIGNSGRFDPNSPSLTDPLPAFAERLAAGARAMEREAKAQGLIPEKPTKAEVTPPKPEDGAEPAAVKPPAPKAEGKPAEGSPDTPAAPAPEESAANLARLDEIQAEFPDLEVLLDGMEKPQRLSDFLAAVKREAEQMREDAPDFEVAANCFLTAGP